MKKNDQVLLLINFFFNENKDTILNKTKNTKKIEKHVHLFLRLFDRVKDRFTHVEDYGNWIPQDPAGKSPDPAGKHRK